MSAFIRKFNAAYDLVARLVKLFVFLAAVALLIWKWGYIDWPRTSTGLIEKHTPFQVQQPQSETTPASTPPSAPLAPTKAKPAPSKKPSKEPQPSTPAPVSSAAPSPKTDYLGVYQFGQLVFSTDKPYEIRGDTIVFDKLLLKGRPDYEKAFLYAGAEIKITHIEQYIGLLISGGSVEGPVLKGVRCEVLRK